MSSGQLIAIVAVFMGLMALRAAFGAVKARLLAVGIEQAADKLAVVFGRLADPAPHDVVIYQRDDSRHDARFHEQLVALTTEAEQAGFVVVGEFEDRTFKMLLADEAPSIARLFLSAQHDMTLALFGSSHGVDMLKTLETEVRSSDGEDSRFINTCAWPKGVPRFAESPSVVIQQRHEAVPLGELVTAHRAFVEAQRGEHQIVRSGDVDALIQHYHRRTALTAAYRQTLPALTTREELLQLGGAQDAATINAVYDHLVELTKKP